MKFSRELHHRGDLHSRESLRVRKHGLIDGLDGNACRLLSNRFPMLVGSFLAFSLMMDVCNFFLKRIFGFIVVIKWQDIIRADSSNS